MEPPSDAIAAAIVKTTSAVHPRRMYDGSPISGREKQGEDEMKGNRAWMGMAMVAALHAGAALAWENYPGFQGPGYAGIAVGDFDGDGRSEAAVSGFSVPGFYPGGSSLLAVLAGDETGTLGVRSISMLPAMLGGRLVPAPREGQADRLAVVAGEGATAQILILGGVPLRVLRTIEAPMIRAVTAVADVDADGRKEIVALTSTSSWDDAYPVVLDYETGAVEWIGDTTAADVGVAQLDGDAALELILAATPGRILDGATHAIEWSFPSGFGTNIVVGRFGTDSSMFFATTAWWGQIVQLFRSQPYSPVSEFAVYDASTVALVRLTPGGADQIAVGGGEFGSIVVYDPRTGQTLLTIPDPAYGTAAITFGDIDGDGRSELVYSSGLNSTGVDFLHAIDLGTLAQDYAQFDEPGPHSTLARGDLQGGGSDQVAYVTFGSESYYEGSNLHVLDAASGRRLRSRVNVVNSSSHAQPLARLAQLDGDASAEIIVAGEDGYSGVVAVLDGTTLEDQWRVSGHESPLSNDWFRALGTIDANGDGVQDVVVVSSATRIFVLDGRDGTVLWRSITLDGATFPALATFRESGAPRVAVSRGIGLYVFDLASHLLVASIKTPANIIGLWQWGEGSACRVAALDEAATVTIHRCDTLALDAQRLMPEGTVFFRPLDAQGSAFMAAAGAYLYEVAADGTATPMAGPLGYQLGAGNQGDVRANPDGQHFDVTIGSDYMVTRIRVGRDAMFANGFD